MSTTINPNYEGLFAQYATFRCDENVKEGSVVNVIGDGKVGLASMEKGFCGIAHAVRNGMCSVQLRGCATLSYLGAAPNYGYSPFLSNDDGQTMMIMQDAKARELLVLDIDPLNYTCTVLL